MSLISTILTKYWYTHRNTHHINIIIIIIVNIMLIINVFFSDFLKPSNRFIESLWNKITSDFVRIHYSIIDSTVHGNTLCNCDDAQVCLNLIRCFASLLRIAELDLRKKNARRFAIVVSFASSVRCIEPQRQATSSSWYRCARATTRIAHAVFFCLSIRTHAPRARDVLAQSYVTLPPRNFKRVRITGKYYYIFAFCTASPKSPHMYVWRCIVRIVETKLII